MILREALEVVARHRGERVVIATMASTGVWPGISDTPLDFNYIPSSMGQGPDLGLGLAIAQPQHGVIVLNGDGSMLMNLGSLVTVANHPANLFVIIIDNGLYEVTGGQPIAGAGKTNFAGLSRAAGIERVHEFGDLDKWRQGAEAALANPGPAVIVLKVEGRLGEKTPAPPRPMPEQLERLRKALGVD